MFLLEGEATVTDVSAILEMPRREAQLAIWVLSSQNQVEAMGKVEPEECRPGYKRRSLWPLTKHGRYLAQRDRRKYGDVVESVRQEGISGEEIGQFVSDMELLAKHGVSDADALSIKLESDDGPGEVGLAGEPHVED